MASKQFPIRRGLHIYEKLLYEKLVLNFSLNYNRNTVGYCSHNNGKQKKNHETFGTEHEAQPWFLIKHVCIYEKL